MWAAILDGLLLRVLPALLFCVPFYPMIGFQADAAHIAVFFCGLAVFSATVGALSMAITVGLGTAGRASLIMVLIILLMLPFTGFLVNVGAMPVVLRWLHYLSVFFYGFQALVVNEVSGLTFNLQVCHGCRDFPHDCAAVARQDSWSRRTWLRHAKSYIGPSCGLLDICMQTANRAHLLALARDACKSLHHEP